MVSHMSIESKLEDDWSSLPGDHPQWYLDAYPLMYMPPSEVVEGPVTQTKFSDDVGTEKRVRQTHIYVHIPFCRRPCDYCVLHKSIFRKDSGMAFLSALNAEIEMMAQSDLTTDIECEWVSFGGGTPTTFQAETLVDLFQSFHRYFPCRDDFQCSMEASTSTCDRKYFDTLLEGGIRRISFGIQSFDSVQRSNLGCMDSATDASETVITARSSGFQNINIDLLYGLPGQTVVDLEKDLDRALALNLECYTIYPLAVYPQSLLFRKIENGTIDSPPVPAMHHRMIDYIAEKMKQAGYVRSWLNQYVRSADYLPPGSLSPGNYLAFGSGAFGTLHHWSYLNNLDVSAYMDTISKGLLPFSRRAPMSSIHRAVRKFYSAFVLHLQLKWQDFDHHERRILTTLLKKYESMGLWTENDEGLVPTQRGMHVADQLVQAILFDSI